jgi:hypothetical protein
MESHEVDDCKALQREPPSTHTDFHQLQRDQQQQQRNEESGEAMPSSVPPPPSPPLPPNEHEQQANLVQMPSSVPPPPSPPLPAGKHEQQAKLVPAVEQQKQQQQQGKPPQANGAGSACLGETGELEGAVNWHNEEQKERGRARGALGGMFATLGASSSEDEE